MNKVLVIAISIQFSLYSYGQLVINQFVPDSLVINLKIESASMQVFFNESKTASLIYTEYYDSIGRVFEMLTFNNYRNFLSNRAEFKYDKHGNISEEKSTRFDGSDSTITINTYSYNQQGFLDSNSFGRIEYQYNKMGQILEMREKTAKSYIPVAEKTSKPDISITKYTYDDRNNLIKEQSYSGSRYFSTTVYHYDDLGRLIEKIQSYGSEDNPYAVYTYKYSYNDLNLLTEYSQLKTLDTHENKKDSRIYVYTYQFK